MENWSSSASETQGDILYTPSGSDSSVPDEGCIADGSDRPFSPVPYLNRGEGHTIRMTGGLSMSGPVRTTDWADQESSQSSGLSYPPESKVDHQGGVAVDQSRLPARPQPRMTRTYSIGTLLKIGQLKQSAHVELRINPAALTENIFKVASSSLRSRQQENLRPRAYTQSSNPTGRSTTSDEAALYDASYIRPVRQPFNPPEISLIQKHAGFARFLKQHASPPHHRVTAGGRIVPAGPQSPPPMMLLPSINAVIANPSSKALNNQQINQADTSIKTSSTFKAPVPPTMGPLAPQNTNVGVHKVFEPTQQASHANNPVGNATTGQIQAPLTNLFGTDLGPLPAGATPIGFLPDGSPLVYFNGVNYQSFWDGHSTTLKPLQLPTSAPLSMNYSAGPHTQMAAGSQYQPVYNVGNLSHSQGFNSQFRGTSGFSYAHERNQQSSVPDVEDVQSLHQQLASELTMLDKHVALHLHEFSSSENQRYTARRRQLVEHLDYLRVNKENKGPLNLASDSGYGAQDDAPWPVVNHLAGAPSIPYPSAVRVNGHSYLPTTPIGTQSDSSQLHSFGYNHRLGPPETPVNKSLSPDAPPFVPGTYMARMPPNRSSVSSHQADIGPSKWEAGRTHGLASPYNRVGQGDASKMATATRGIISDENKGATASMSRNLNTSLESQSTEILPTVNLKEIEYTKEHGFNPLHGEKRYCTTVEEFQEVLRRVREQAQMYGCSGGQSKDPAYDAEQDVRWAMADNEPIPLPMGPPDHVAYPRPWNWADSAYNNSNRSLKIGPEWPLGTARQNNFDRILEGWDSKPRPLGDEWRMGPKPGGVKDHKGGPEVFRKKDFGKREISSGWPLQKQPPVQGDCDTGFPSNLRSTPSKGAQPQPSGAAHHLANHQSYMESVPETLAKAKGYYGNSAPNNRINGQAPEVGPLVPFKDSNSGWGPTKRQSDWDKHSALLEETWAREKRTISTVQPDTNSRFTGPWSESLSSGGVESDTPSFLVDSFSGSHDHKNALYNQARGAKVNLPRYHGGHGALPATTSARQQFSSEMEPAVNFAKLPSDNEPPAFLRGMLKSPRYSATRFHQSEPFDSMQYPTQADKRVEDGWNSNYANKENFKSEGYQDAMFGYGRGAKNNYDAAHADHSAGQGAYSNKARSSLAASSYHATGRLPQYDGAGEEALGATNRQPYDKARSEPRHILIDQSGSAVGSTDLGSSSRLEQAKLWDVDMTIEYDNRGLTQDDFITNKDAPVDAQAHHARVDRFFDRLYEGEEFHELSTSHSLHTSSLRRS